MPLRSRALLVLLSLAACRGGDEHPEEVVGTWVAVRDGPVVDRMAFRPDGAGWASRYMYGRKFRPDARGAVQVDTMLVRAFKPAPVLWRVQRNDDGRHLCIVYAAPADSACAPLEVVPGTAITVGDVTFERVR